MPDVIRKLKSGADRVRPKSVPGLLPITSTILPLIVRRDFLFLTCAMIYLNILPQVAENNTPRQMDVTGDVLL